jgi:hypothetical protein
MTRWLLAITGALASVVGLALCFGVALRTPVDGMLVRTVGVFLLALGLTNWFARNADGVGLRAVLIGNIVAHIGLGVVNALGVVAGATAHEHDPITLVASVVHVALAVAFGLALRQRFVR